jgi:hypothetical protein|tara:strand:+ start:32 stop:214 length:183 start_codon:yes stop_codon:yes gene_type:complete
MAPKLKLVATSSVHLISKVQEHRPPALVFSSRKSFEEPVHQKSKSSHVNETDHIETKRVK